MWSGSHQVIRIKAVIHSEIKLKNYSETDLREEMAARATEHFLFDKTAIQQFAKENKSVARKIYDYIVNILKELKEAFKGIAAHNKEAEILSYNEEVWEQARQLWFDAINGENSSLSTENRENSAKMGTKSAEEITAIGKEIVSNKGNLKDKYTRNKIAIDKVSDTLKNAVLYATDGKIDISEKTIVLDAGKTWHEIKNHSNKKTEEGMGQVAYTEEDLNDFVDAIKNPDFAEDIGGADKLDNRNAVVVAKKNTNYYIAVLAIGGNRHAEVTPEQLLIFNESKWNHFIESGDALVEWVYQKRERGAISEERRNEIKKNRVSEESHELQGSFSQTSKTIPRSSLFNNNVAQETETVNRNIPTVKKFSLKSPVEITKDLVAVHNLSEDKLMKTLELGGFPMPSIAVTKAEMGWENFGDISVLFGSDTINPSVNKKNKVYGADAWTPVVPRIEYDVDYAAVKKLEREFDSNMENVPEFSRNGARTFVNQLEYNMDSIGGVEGAVERYANDPSVINYYLSQQGKAITEEVTKETRKRLAPGQIDEAQRFVDEFGEDIVDIARMSGRDAFAQYGDRIKRVLAEYYCVYENIA